ncbi:MAG TPA: hypothetical protein VMW42_13545 [Desulfatiglandales bacterium]|nr:hypothetical protein [Desulfatiglandales bacterium]
MKRVGFIFTAVMLVFFLIRCNPSNGGSGSNGNGNDIGGVGSTTPASGFIIDHTCTDLSQIPDEWLQKAKEQFRIHYAHTSHGEQIVVGLERLSAGGVQTFFRQDNQVNQSSKYRFYYAFCEVPSGQDGLRMMDGQRVNGYCETYVTPDLYWESDYGINITRSVLVDFDVNVSLWAWCCQQDYYSEAETQTCLDRMAALEEEFPDQYFIYMTGNAQSEERNRVERNNQIREYCKDNNKFLFDFADLDCWYNGQQHTVNGIPMEHPHFQGDEAGHTTYESCEIKARAFWWLMARLAGWEGSQA